MPKRLQLDDIPSLRAQSEPLSTQIAGYVSSHQFKSPANSTKCQSTPLSHHHLSNECREFAGSELKKTANKPVKERIIPLGTGRPHADMYPWQGMTLESRSRPRTHCTGEAGDHSIVFQSTHIRHRGDDFDLARGLNYGHAAGSQALVRFMTEHVELVHDPPYADWSTCLTCGSTSAMEILFRMLCNRGETILTERYTYPGTLDAAQLLDLQVVGVEMDAGGLLPDALEEVLSGWDESRQGRRPSVLYTIPSGQNPTGITQRAERKTSIYRVAEAYNLIIIEDDPYYFLRLRQDSQCVRADQFSASSFISDLPPSYLRIDQSGRVIRLDSTSKILAPGLRAGWITAREELIDKFQSYTEVSTVAVSGPTQLFLWQLLEFEWGHIGFFAWLHQLSVVYQSRLEALIKACDDHLPSSICSWTRPINGMFLWIALDLTRHPSFSQTDHIPGVSFSKQVEARICEEAMRKRVQITPGSLFDVQRKGGNVLYFRLTFAAAEEEEFDLALTNLAQAIRDEFGSNGARGVANRPVRSLNVADSHSGDVACAA